VGSARYVFDIDDDLWHAFVIGKADIFGKNFGPITNYCHCAIHSSKTLPYSGYNIAYREREQEIITYINEEFPRYASALFSAIKNKIDLGLRTEETRHETFQMLGELGMLHLINGQNGYEYRDFMDAGRYLVSPYMQHYKKFGFWHDLEVASWTSLMGEAGILVNGLRKSSQPLIMHSFDDMLLKTAPQSERSAMQFLSEGDQLFGTLGPARLNHRAEYDAILSELRENGVEVTFREGALAYGPAPSAGRVGNMVLDPDASISAIRHEFNHFLDDKALGYPGFAHYAQNPKLWIATERRSYLGEILLARQVGDKTARRKLIEAYVAERRYIIERYYPRTD